VKSHELTVGKMASMIEHTFLRPNGTPGDIVKFCEEAKEHRFIGVCVNPWEISNGVARLEGSGVIVVSVIGFPLGQNTTAVKEYETKDAIQRGAKEIDMVINIRALQAGAMEVVSRDMRAVVRACEAGGAASKVIIETCYLTDAEKRVACVIADNMGARFVKTSTGFGAGGATVEDVRLIRSSIRKEMGLKAAGGIRDLKTALDMINAGATRIGTSTGVAILSELKEANRI
jgi:deoxyribose-phosphate aldolase